MRRLLIVAATLAATFAAAESATAAGPTMTLMPSSVVRGHSVVIKGSAGGCAVGNRVTIISKAFVHTHDFAGLPAVFARVRSNGGYRVTTKIPATKRPGRYGVTARCGGGNFGILRHLTVRR